MSVPALGMSQTKEELLKQLNMRSETYSLMSKETDRIYKWLTSDTVHLKKNCTRDPPYDWNDITEKSKYEAMLILSHSGDDHTSSFWERADESNSEGCPNWIAKWFLYHKFRYRDRRNRNRDTEKVPSSKVTTQRTNNKPPKSYDETQQDFENDFDYSAKTQPQGATGHSESTNLFTITSAQAPSAAHAYLSYSQLQEQQPTTSISSGFYDPVKGWVQK